MNFCDGHFWFSFSEKTKQNKAKTTHMPPLCFTQFPLLTVEGFKWKEAHPRISGTSSLHTAHEVPTWCEVALGLSYQRKCKFVFPVLDNLPFFLCYLRFRSWKETFKLLGSDDFSCCDANDSHIEQIKCPGNQLKEEFQGMFILLTNVPS